MPQEGESTPQEGQEPAPATEPKEGQEPQGTPPGESKTFDEGYVKQLRSENAQARKRAQEAEAKVTEFEEKDKGEIEKLTGKVSKAEQRAIDAEAKLIRFEVASEKSVPAKLVPLLTGSSREELEAQADLILENSKPETPDFDGGAREPAPEPDTPAQAHNKLAVQLFGQPQQ